MKTMKGLYESPRVELLSFDMPGILVSSPGGNQEPGLRVGSDKTDPNESWASEYRDWGNIWQ